MKARVLVTALIAVVVCVGLFVAFSNVALAAEEKAKIVGKVSVTKDDDGNITAVKLTAGETVYNVTLDDNGKKLGKEMAGKKVEATGTVSEKEDQKWLTVESYKEVKEEE